jgi:hypothetical protein
VYWPASVPVRVKLVIVSGPLPELVNVIGGDAAALSPTFTLPKAKLAADKLTAGTTIPVPVRAIACGLSGASSATLTLALRAPVAVGLNRTPKKQELPALMLLAANEHAGEPLAGAANTKSPGLVPVKVMLVTLIVEEPLLVSCTSVVALVVPTNWVLNGTLVGLSVTVVRAVPTSATFCGLVEASSATLTLALRAPAAAGLNRTPKKQELPGLMLLAANEHAGEPLAGAANTKSPGLVPVKVMLVTLIVEEPLLVSCTSVVALVVPTTWVLNGTPFGLSATVPVQDGKLNEPMRVCQSPTAPVAPLL